MHAPAMTGDEKRQLLQENSSGVAALFMTVRREIAQSPGETGARSREGGRHT